MIQTCSRGTARLFPSSWFCKRRKGDNARTASFFIIYCLMEAEAEAGLDGDGALCCNLGAPPYTRGNDGLGNLLLEWKGL